MFRKCIISLVLCIVSFCNIQKVHAAFDLNITNASYDSNTGYLTIYDSNFSERNSMGYYSASLSKIKLNGIALTGSYQFNSGTLKINVSNKDTINEQINSSQNNIMQDGLYLSYGAISKNTYPPNSINVVTSSLSNEKTINLNIIKLIPKIVINSFTSNTLTVNSSGGEIVVTVTGDNLDTGLLKIQSLNSSYNLNVNKKIATARINIPENFTANNRTDIFTLYLNGYKTDKIISVTVLPTKSDQDNIDSDNNQDNGNNMPSDNNQGNSNNIPSDNNQGNNNNIPSDNNQGNGNNIPSDNNQGNSNNVPSDNNQDNSNNVPSDNNQDNSNNVSSDNNLNNNNIENKDFLVEKSNKKTSEKSKYVIVLSVILVVIIGILIYVKRMKRHKKTDLR